MIGAEVQERVAPLLPLVAERAAAANRARRPDPEVFAALARAGLLRLLAPAAHGGAELAPRVFLDLIETVAAVDGATGWTLMTVNEEVGIASAFLDPEVVTDLLTSEPAVIVAGAGAPAGRAEPVAGGWSLTGHWPIVTGCTVADRLVLGTWVDREGAVRAGRPVARSELCFVLVPADEATILDSWYTAGLAGTGSHDVAVDEVFVPTGLSAVVAPRALPRPTAAPFYRLPNSLRFCFPKVGVAMGVARAALSAFEDLAGDKVPTMSNRLLAQRPHAQRAVAAATASIESGRAWVDRELDALWSVAVDGRAIDPRLHARVRLACAHAVAEAISAVETLASATGTTGGRTDGPWPRLLADVRSVAQHFMVSPYQMDTAGRMLLGQDPGDPLF